MKIKLKDSHPADSVKVEVSHGVWVVVKKRFMVIDDDLYAVLKAQTSLEFADVPKATERVEAPVEPVVKPVVKKAFFE